MVWASPTPTRCSVSPVPDDRQRMNPPPEPTMVLDPRGAEGPVLVTVEYNVPKDRAEAFVEAMRPVGLSWLRTGALTWDLYQDGTRSDRYLETFLVPSWEEHLRQHGGRVTGSDRAAEERARALNVPARPFRVTHCLPARPHGDDRASPHRPRTDSRRRSAERATARAAER
jgi:transmembrane secretion effector